MGILTSPGQQTSAVRPVLAQVQNARPILRPFSTLGSSAFHQMNTIQKLRAMHMPETQKPIASMTQCTMPSAVGTQLAEKRQVTETVTEAINDVKKNAMVFEIGISCVFLHYQSIFIGVMRCLFQAFRPLLILFVFGQIIKAVFFIAGAPIWMSFYSIWLFEVTYGLAKCAISFIFISFFYNNLSFARIRPALSSLFRQHRDKMAQCARALL